MKKNPVILIGVLLIVILGILELPKIFENKPEVTFTGIENVSFQYAVKNNRNYDCLIQPVTKVVNGTSLTLECANKIFPIVVSKKSVVVSGLHKLEILSFDKLQIQLMEINMDLKNLTFIYYLENPDANDLERFGVSLFLVYVSNYRYSHYTNDRLFVLDEHYHRADVNSGVFEISLEALTFNHNEDGDIEDLETLISKFINLGYKEMKIAK